MQNFNAITMWRILLADPLAKAHCVVDATAGNGGDTLYLAENSHADAVVYAFDLQEQAMNETRRKTAAYKEKIQYILDNHAHFQRYVPDAIDLAVFNLGYLPGGDHAMTTTAQTTLAAVQGMLSAIRRHGVVAIVAYPGHAEGKDEQSQLADYLESLPMKQFTVGLYKMINHSEKAPILYLVEKVREEK